VSEFEKNESQSNFKIMDYKKIDSIKLLKKTKRFPLRNKNHRIKKLRKLKQRTTNSRKNDNFINLVEEEIDQKPITDFLVLPKNFK